MRREGIFMMRSTAEFFRHGLVGVALLYTSLFFLNNYSYTYHYTRIQSKENGKKWENENK